MDYAFSVGFDILNFQDYAGLTDSGRGQVRASLRASVQSIIDQMGVFDVTDPAVKLAQILGDASSAEAQWTLGAAAVRGWIYRINPVTGKEECIWVGELLSNSMPHQVQVIENGLLIGAIFHVSYIAENGPY